VKPVKPETLLEELDKAPKLQANAGK